MAGDRHGKHNTTTISFRVNSYEKATIEERVKVSGMKKQDYIVRSCIISEPVLDSMTERYLAFLEAALWMLKGSSYLWEDKKDGRESNEGL